MKRALLVVCCGALSACFPFDDRVDELCRDGGLSNCPVADAGADGGDLVDSGSPDAGDDDSGVPDAGPPDAGEPDGGANDAGMNDAGETDAGIDDAGTMDAGTIDDGGQQLICKHGWCWENPLPLGAVSLDAIWGNSDNDFWVGGGGGLVFHYDGSRWQKEALSDTLAWNNIIQFGFVTDTGENWVCPSNAQPLQLNGSTFPGWSTGVCGVADWWAGETYFGSLANSPLLRSTAPELPTINDAPLPDTRLVMGVGANAIAIAEDGNSSGTIAWYDDAGSHRSLLFNANDGGQLRWIQNFARGPGDELYALANGFNVVTVGRLVDGGWVFQPLPSGLPVLFDFGYAADGGWWFIGNEIYFAAGVSDPLQPPVIAPTLYQSLYAGWESPSGTLWSVGSGGLVKRNGQLKTPLIQAPVFDVLPDDPAIAVGGFSGNPGTIWRHDGGAWVNASLSGNRILAASRHADGGLVTFNLDGQAFNGTTPLTIGSVNTDRATMAVDTDDAIWLATPDAVQFWSSVGHAVVPAPTNTEFSDLVAGPDGGVFITLRDVTGMMSGGLAFMRAETDAGLGWLAQNTSLNAVAAFNGGVAAIGPDDVQVCNPTCNMAASAPNGSPLSLVALTDNDFWLLQNSGVVLHWTGSTWEETTPPINEYFLVSRMRATRDGKTLYLVGDDGAILRRSLP